MSEQLNWVPLPRKRVRPAKIEDALSAADRLIDWYLANKASVHRLVVSKADYQAFEKKVGTHGIKLDEEGIKYRDFLIAIER